MRSALLLLIWSFSLFGSQQAFSQRVFEGRSEVKEEYGGEEQKAHPGRIAAKELLSFAESARQEYIDKQRIASILESVRIPRSSNLIYLTVVERSVRAYDASGTLLDFAAPSFLERLGRYGTSVIVDRKVFGTEATNVLLKAYGPTFGLNYGSIYSRTRGGELRKVEIEQIGGRLAFLETISASLFFNLSSAKECEGCEEIDANRVIDRKRTKIISLSQNSQTREKFSVLPKDNRAALAVVNEENILKVVRRSKGQVVIIVGHVENGDFVIDQPNGGRLSLARLMNEAAMAGTWLLPIGCNSASHVSQGLLTKFNTVDVLSRLQSILTAKQAYPVKGFFTALAADDLKFVIDPQTLIRGTDRALTDSALAIVAFDNDFRIEYGKIAIQRDVLTRSPAVWSQPKEKDPVWWHYWKIGLFTSWGCIAVFAICGLGQHSFAFLRFAWEALGMVLYLATCLAGWGVGFLAYELMNHDLPISLWWTPYLSAVTLALCFAAVKVQGCLQSWDRLEEGAAIGLTMAVVMNVFLTGDIIAGFFYEAFHSRLYILVIGACGAAIVICLVHLTNATWVKRFATVCNWCSLPSALAYCVSLFYLSSVFFNGVTGLYVWSLGLVPLVLLWYFRTARLWFGLFSLIIIIGVIVR